MKTHVLVTGANGFVGGHLIEQLKVEKYILTGALRDPSKKCLSSAVRQVFVGDINNQTDWSSALEGVQVVIHLAARVHVMKETASDALRAFRVVNVEGTIRLAEQAAKAGVKRFIFLSTIKVNGEATESTPFSPDHKPSPKDPYAISKWEAEEQLLRLRDTTGMEVVIIRPPLVYGPGVKGNFIRLLQLVQKGIPLPLAQINNLRSLVCIQNLCSFIECCVDNKKAPGEVFFISDGEDLSTTDLFLLISKALEAKSRLFYIPKSFIKWMAALLGRESEYERLFGSLQVSIDKNFSLLEWKPRWGAKDGIGETVRWYKGIRSLD